VLCDPSRDELWELKWAAFGSFVTTAPAFIQALVGYFSSPNHEMGALDLSYVVITIVALAIWVVLRFVVQQKSSTSLTKRDEIRARTKKITETLTNVANQ